MGASEKSQAAYHPHDGPTRQAFPQDDDEPVGEVPPLMSADAFDRGIAALDEVARRRLTAERDEARAEAARWKARWRATVADAEQARAQADDARDVLLEAQGRAWDEGFEAGEHREWSHATRFDEGRPENPYRIDPGAPS